MKYLLIFLLFLSTSLFANIGKITALKGDASIIRDAKTLVPKTGFIIEKNDKISTQSNARLQVVFKDNTIISLGKNTSFSINDYFYDEKQPKKTKATFGVAKGIFKTITGRIGKINPNKFKLKTRSAAIGIRGTIFFGEQKEGSDSISCTQGKISVTTPQGTVEVNAGEMTKVEIGKPPSAPAKLSTEQKGALEKDSGASENEEESGQTAAVAEEKQQEEEQKEEKKEEAKEEKKEDSKDEGTKEESGTAESTDEGPNDPDGGGVDTVDADIDLGEPEIEIEAPQVDSLVDNVVDDTKKAVDTVVVNKAVDAVINTGVHYTGFTSDGNHLYSTINGSSYNGYIGYLNGVETYEDNGISQTYPKAYLTFNSSATTIPFSGSYPSVTTDSNGNSVTTRDLVTGTATPSSTLLGGIALWGTSKTTYLDKESDKYKAVTDGTYNGAYVLEQTSSLISNIASWVTSSSATTATYNASVTGYINNVTFIDPTKSWVALEINFNDNIVNTVFHINGTAKWLDMENATMAKYTESYRVNGTAKDGRAVSLYGNLYNSGTETIGSFNITTSDSSLNTAQGVYAGTTAKTAATKSVTYYSMHSASSELEYEKDSYGDKQWVNGLDGNTKYKTRGDYLSSYVMENGKLTVKDELTKYTYDTVNKRYTEDSIKDYSYEGDFTNSIISPSYIGFKNIKILEDSSEPNFKGAIFADSQKEFVVLLGEQKTYYVKVAGVETEVYKNTDGTFGTDLDLTTAGSYTDSDIYKMYEYERGRVFGEKTKWNTVKDLTGVSKYLDPNINSAVGDLIHTEVYSSNENVVYTTNGTYVNWDNKTFIHFDMETHSNTLFIGSVSEDSDGNAYLKFRNIDHRVNNNDLSLVSSGATGNEGFIFGSDYQGFAVTVADEQVIGDNTYKKVTTHGEFRNPVAEQTTTNYTDKTATGFANENYGSNGHTIGMPLELTFAGTGVSGNIGTGINSDKIIAFGGAFDQQKSAYINPNIFAALSFNGIYNRDGSDYTVKDGMLVAIEDGTSVDDGISWGIWAVDSDTTDSDANLGRDIWIASVNQRVEDITALDDYTNGAIASYSGQAMGWLGDYETGHFINPANSTLSFKMDFSSSEKFIKDLALNGSVMVNDVSKTFSGSASDATFNLNDAKNTFSTNNIKGSLYNGGASSIGSFNMGVTIQDDNSNYTATGVYKATKQ